MIPKLRKPTIMLVEDDPADLKLIRSIIERPSIDHKIVIKKSAEEALDFLNYCKSPEELSIRPDLVILDLNMPGLGGREFLRIIKDDDVLKQIPIVILTSSTSEQDISDSYNLEAAGFITKPACLKEFEQVIHGITEYWFVLCKLPLKEF